MTGPDREIALGVTGSIAAYKAAELARIFRRNGLSVTAILTESAGHLIGAETFRALTGRPVVTGLWNDPAGGEIQHTSLADRAVAVVVAPATANILGKLAGGIADDFLSTFLLAYHGPVILAPAMNVRMYEHPAVQANLELLRKRGARIVEPGLGELACGHIGRGRLAELDLIMEEVQSCIEPGDLTGRKVLITAGPTREALDPVRFLSNRSTGRMGIALAETARRRGAEVILVLGPTELAPPPGIEVVRVESAEEMRQAVLTAREGLDAVIMAAAVADFRPGRTAPDKIKKIRGLPEISLEATRDILAELGADRREKVLVGFAAETDRLLPEARRKLAEKNLDLMVANDVSRSDAGFGSDRNAVTILPRSGEAEEIALRTKREVANRIWDRVGELF